MLYEVKGRRCSKTLFYRFILCYNKVKIRRRRVMDFFKQNGELTLICDKRKTVNDRPNITLKSNVKIQLEVKWGNKQSMVIKI